MDRCGIRFGVFVVAAISIAAAAQVKASEPSSTLPRYRLQVGQELIYESNGEFKYNGGEQVSEGHWNIWVVRANADGSWRLVLRSKSKVRFGKISVANDNTTIAYCDMFPDGRILENDSFAYHMKPQSIFPRLPRDDAERAKGWTSRDERMDETIRYHQSQKPAAAGRFILESVDESPMNQIYGMEHKDTITFDTERGFPEKTAMTNQQTYGFNGKGTGATKLVEVKMHDGTWCQDFAAEADCYFKAQADYEHALRSKKTAAEMKEALDQGESRLNQARKELKMADWQKQVDDSLATHKKMKKYYMDEVANRSKILDKPAADWKTTDLDGKSYALKDLRGKVVVLDFWYRGCGWCIRSMPQMKLIAEHFKNQPVQVFGMNTDSKVADAKFVIEKMGLTYSNLKATGIPAKYKIQGFPTLLIIDQEGVVRDIHVGYSSTLKEEIVESVNKLLKQKL